VYKLIEENNFFSIGGLDRETLEFGVFYTALKSKPILNFIGKPTDPVTTKSQVDVSRLKELTQWVYEKVEDPRTGKPVTRLGESRNITRLSRVLNNESALKAFRAGEQIELFEQLCGEALDKIKQAAGMVNENREKLTKHHARTTSTITVEAEELHDRVNKYHRVNERV